LTVLRVFLVSRLLIWAVALYAGLEFEPPHPPEQGVLGFDLWVRWDGYHFYRIARDGYVNDSETAFFPLYPGLMALPGRLIGFPAAGVIISLTACFGAFVLFRKWAAERIPNPDDALILLAFSPMALYLNAVYSEALYLLLVLGVFLLAERRRWWLAGLLTGLALLTRPTGAVLVPILILMAWKHRKVPQALAGSILFLVFPLVLWLSGRSPWAVLHTERVWGRDFSPLGGLWFGTREAWYGVLQILDLHNHWDIPENPLRVAVLDIQCFAFLVVYLILTVMVWRRFGHVYGLFAALSLALPLSEPHDTYPLLSLPRFGLVIFPFYAVLAGRRVVLAISAVLLGLATVQWSLAQWVS
jgi:hypothetical protein